MPDIFDRINPSQAAPAPTPVQASVQKADIFDRINPPKQSSEIRSDVPQPPLDQDPMTAQGTFGPREIRILSEGLPMAGGMFGGIPGAAAGAFAKQAINPGNPNIGDVIKDTVLQGVVPEGIGALLSPKKAMVSLISKLPLSLLERIPGYSKALIASKLANKMYPEADLVQTAATNAADQSSKMTGQIEKVKFPGRIEFKGPGLTNSVSPEEAIAVAKYNSKYADNPVGEQLLKIQKQLGISGDQPLSSVPKLILSDVKHVENAILATGDPTIVKQIATSDLVTRNFTPSTKSFDAANMLNEMAGEKADAYKLAMGDGYKPFKELLELGVKKGVGKETPNLFSWQEGRKLAITGTALSFLGIPFKATEAVIFGADALRKVAGNPELGQLILQAAKTGPKAPEAGFLMKTALRALIGTTVYLQNEDGQKDPATIQMDSKTGEPQLQYQQSNRR